MRTLFDPSAVLNSIDGLQTILIACFGVLGMWTLGVIAVLLIIRD